jgi:hypothetical protein
MRTIRFRDARSALRPLLLWTLCAAVGAGAAGCAGDGVRRDPNLGFISTEVGEGGTEVEKLDVNGDGRPDIWRHFALVEGPEGRPQRLLVRKEIDLNFDGEVDIRIHLSPAGTVTKEEFDLDFDGRIDMVAEYEDGVLVTQSMDEGFDGTVDVWRYFEGGALVRKERDSDHDGRVDVWEYYQDGRLIRIGRDVDRDGRPEMFEEATPDGGEGAAAGEDAPPAAAEEPAPAEETPAAAVEPAPAEETPAGDE